MRDVATINEKEFFLIDNSFIKLLIKFLFALQNGIWIKASHGINHNNIQIKLFLKMNKFCIQDI